MTAQDADCGYNNIVARAIGTVVEQRFSAGQHPITGLAITATIRDVALDLDEWLAEFLRFIEDGRQDAGNLEQFIARFVNLFRQTDTLPLLRPWIFVVKRFRRIVLEIQYLAAELLKHHRSADSSSCDGLTQSAQSSLRAINDQSAELGEALDTWGAFTYSSHPDEAILHLSSRIGIGAASIRGMERHFRELKASSDECFFEITGKASGCPEALDMLLLIAKREVEFLGDVDNFFLIAKGAYEYLVSRPEKARLLLESPEWLQALSKGLALSYFDSDTASAVIAATKTQPGLLGGLLNLGKDIVESWSRIPVSTILALRSRTLGYWQRQDAGAALRAASQGDSALLVAGLPIAIRNAAAHHSWHLKDDEISFVDNQGEARLRMKWPELTDALLAGAENYIALVVGLSSAAAVMGAGMTPLVDAAKIHLPYELNIRSAAAFAGYTELYIEEVDKRLVVSVPGIPIDLRIIGIASSFAAFAPNDFKTLEVVSSAGRGFVSNIEPLRQWLYETRPYIKHGAFWGIAGKLEAEKKHLIPQGEYEIIIARCAHNFLARYSSIQARTGLELALPTIKERSSRLYRAVNALMLEEEQRSGSREEKSLLAWLARRASLPMPKLPGWQ